VILAGLAGLAYVSVASRNTSRLQRIVDQLDHEDPGWRMEEIEAAREQVPDAENSTVPLLAAAAGLSGFPPTDLDQLLSGLSAEKQLHPTQIADLKKELHELEAARASARQLADRPRGRFAPEPLTHPLAISTRDQMQTRLVAVLLRYDLLDRAQDNDPRGALRSCRAILNAGRSLNDEPIMISQFVRFAMVAITTSSLERALAQTEPEPADLKLMQDLLAREEASNALKVALRGERAFSHRAFESVEKGKITGGELMDGRPSSPSVLGWYQRARMRGEHALALEVMTRRVSIADLPVHEQAAADAALIAEFKKILDAAPLAKGMLSSVGKFSEAYRRNMAQLRCALAACAAERYRRERGSWPARLADLVPGYIAAVPLDPFDGKPLRLKRTGDGLIVYSVGQDGVDDGGMIDRQNPVGSKDMGFLLWDVDKRRQAAAPPARVP
jgi:hypothetical protein